MNVSPLQLAGGSTVFERFVVEPLLRLKGALDAAGALLFLHDCGELADPMLEALAWRVRPAVLSLGSSRRLWEDARLVPHDVVLFGSHRVYKSTDNGLSYSSVSGDPSFSKAVPMVALIFAVFASAVWPRIPLEGK